MSVDTTLDSKQRMGAATKGKASGLSLLGSTDALLGPLDALTLSRHARINCVCHSDAYLLLGSRQRPYSAGNVHPVYEILILASG